MTTQATPQRRQRYRRRPPGSDPTRAHSVRVTDGVWAGAMRRAYHEGVTVSFAAAQLLEGYATGHIDLPERVLVYQADGRRVSVPEQPAS